MSEDLLMTEWKGSSRIDGDREAGDGTDLVVGQQTASPVVLRPPLQSSVQQPYQTRRVDIGGTGVSPNGDVAFHGTNETSKLLELSSSSSSESDLNLQIVPPKRKIRFKRKIRQKVNTKGNKGSSRDEVQTTGSHGCCCCSGGEGLGALALLLVSCALGALMWFHYGLSSRVDALQKQYNNMEAQSKETPEALHDYHIQLKGLESNVTAFGLDIKKINTEILSLHDAVKQLKEVSNGLSESIAAAPEIKSLPKDVISVTESVAAMGSKISMLESTVTSLKEGQKQLTDSARELKSEHQQIKGTLTGLNVQKEAATQDDTKALKNSLTEFLHQELISIATSVDDLNATIMSRSHDFEVRFMEVNESLSWVANDLSQLHVFVYQNLSKMIVDPFPLLQQETQHVLSEVLNGSSGIVVLNTSTVESLQQASTWQEVLSHARQVVLAYWSLLRDLSLGVPSQSSIPEGLLAAAVAHLTANTTSALNALNMSMQDLGVRTGHLESLHQPNLRSSEEIMSTATETPPGNSLPLASAPRTDSDSVALPPPKPSPQERKDAPIEGDGASLQDQAVADTNGGAPDHSNPAPTVPAAILQKLRSGMFATASAATGGSQPDLEAIF